MKKEEKKCRDFSIFFHLYSLSLLSGAFKVSVLSTLLYVLLYRKTEKSQKDLWKTNENANLYM